MLHKSLTLKLILVTITGCFGIASCTVVPLPTAPEGYVHYTTEVANAYQLRDPSEVQFYMLGEVSLLNEAAGQTVAIEGGKLMQIGNQVYEKIDINNLTPCKAMSTINDDYGSIAALNIAFNPNYPERTLHFRHSYPYGLARLFAVDGYGNLLPANVGSLTKYGNTIFTIKKNTNASLLVKVDSDERKVSTDTVEPGFLVDGTIIEDSHSLNKPNSGDKKP